MAENLTTSNIKAQATEKPWERVQKEQQEAVNKTISANGIAYTGKDTKANLQRYAIPQEMFDTPTMGDFYLGGVDDIYLRKLDAIVQGKATKVEDAESKEGDGRKAVFYTEAPSFSELGTDNNNHFFLKAATDANGLLGNWQNGKTVRVRLDSLKSEKGDDTAETYRKKIKDAFTPCDAMTDEDYVTVSLYGITCPIAARLAFDKAPANQLKIAKVDGAKVKENPGSYVYINAPKAGVTQQFIQIGNKYHEYIPMSLEGNLQIFKWAMISPEGEGNPEASTALINRLTHEEVYVMLDGTTSSPHAAVKNMANDAAAVATLKEWAGNDNNPNSGYRLLRQAMAGSLMGTAYVKVDGKWVNAAKAVVADAEKTKASADKNFTGGSDNETFKNNYDIDKTEVADGYFKVWEQLDDRKAIQKKVLKKDWSELKDWTVTIGDVTLMVPPTSIIVQSSTVNDAMPLLRARGAMPVGAKYDIRTLQIPVYFCDNDGINGYKIEETAPNGTKMTYSINGLRALLSQFRFTPFLPIENTYLNEVIGIQAVTFDTISIQTVPGMPRLMQVNLYMREFHYEAYIPEVALLGAQMDMPNPFSAAFNWKTMRYYYQRAIMAGDKLRNTGYDVNSKEYLNEALKYRTAFQPMRFEDSSMKFFIADPSYLDKMLASKKQREKMLENATQFTDDANKVIRNMGEVGQAVKKIFYTDDFKNKLKSLEKIRYDLRKDKNITSRTNYEKDYFPPNSGLVDEEGNDATKEVLDFCYSLKEELKAVPGVKSAECYYCHTDIKVGTAFGVKLKIEGLQNEDTRENLRKNMAPLINIPNNMAEHFLDEDYICIGFTVPDVHKTDEHIAFRADTFDNRALDFALNDLKSSPRAKNDGSGEASTDGWMKAPLMAQLDNMRFKPLDTGVFYITSISASLRNTFSNVHLQESGKSCAQFLGGQDTEINVSIQTTDTEAVKMIEELPNFATMMMRKYRQVIPCYPIKVDSEFTRFLGVSEVMIDNVTVSTIDNHPGAYNISITMKSMDRTLRSRESMEMIQANNGGYRASSWADDAADFFSGKKSRTDVYQAKKMKSFFDIQTTMAHAELYPDLELPTLAEMSTLGYDFLRYKFQDNRVYVDPDFYFVYLTRLSSQLLRETILNSVKAGIDGTRTVTDASGAKYTVAPVEQKGFDLVGANTEAERQLNVLKAARDAQYELNAKQTTENLQDKSRVGATVEDYDSWDICNDIKVLFLEKRYKKEIESYDARKKASSAQASFEQPGTSTDESSQVKATDDTTQVKATDDTTQVKATNDTSQVKGTKNGKPMSEGAWVAQQLANADKAAEKIADYLKNVPIKVGSPTYSSCRDSYLKKKANDEDLKASFDSVKSSIEAGVRDFLATPEIIEIFDLLDIERTDNFRSLTEDIVFAAACSATGSKEYSSKKKATDWMPSPDYMGIKVPASTQNISQAASAETFEEALEEANIFGAFNIRQYTADELLQITGENPVDVWSDEEKKESPLNASRFLLDRYYRYKPLATIRWYKQGCINSPKFCAVAYMRNMLYWLRRLIMKRAFPSINGDVLRKATKTEQQIQKAEEKNSIPARQSDAELRDHIMFFTKNAYAIDAGKMWTCSMLALSDGNKLLRDRINSRDYRGLNEYLHGVSVPSTPVSPDDRLSSGMRKSNLALAALGRQENKIAAGVKADAPSSRKVQQMDNQLYIKAADDPKQYMMHSCHDMIVYDARGRMLRAFPTYYMMLIDEGRELGSYKLHDNFYNATNIVSFDVIKDRKNPADTAHITLTNVYQAESTTEDTRLRAKESSTWDAFRSIFSPSTLGEDEEDRRTKNSGVLDQLNLRAGARIHLRAGYGSNAVMLPIIFNGVIAEINSEATVEIVAQGDGVELCNPIMDDMEAQNIDQEVHPLSNGSNPKDIINDMLTTSGGFIAKRFKGTFGRPDILGDNPYGIYHFGDKDFKDIVASGEPTQNIFDALPTPVWDKESDGGVIFDQAPSISFDVFGKTPWDIINICRSVMPDFVAAVAPFDFRSTIFVGHPRYYYAYSYSSTNGVVREKRKPFQQFHMYTSAADIVGNGITATSQNVKTTATGLYQVTASFNTKEQHKVGPLYADIDIYPEDQKLMIVDTQLLAKGIPYIGAMGANFFTSFECIDQLFSNDEFSLFNATGGHNMSAKGIAWRMTASALKDSMKEMYAGDMVVLGDTSIKPHDRMYINDTYTGISGQCTVKEVVHHMSLENGFITTISPDCINTVQDTFEPVVAPWCNLVTANAAVQTLMVANFIRVLWSHATKASEMEAFKNLGKKLLGGTVEKVESAAAKHATVAGALELGSAAGGLAKELGGTAVDAAKGLGKKAIEKVGEGALGRFLARLGSHVLAGSVGGPVGIAASIAAAVAETVVIETVGRLVVNSFKRNARDLQVITLYPLKRYGRPWVAGVAGTKGMVYGTPSFGDNGPYTKIMNKIADIDTPSSTATGEDTGINTKDPSMAISNFSAAMLDSPELWALAKKDVEQYSGSVDTNGDPTLKSDDFDETMLTVMSSAKNGAQIKNDYRAMQLAPRVDYTNGKETQEAYKRYAMLNTSKFLTDSKLKNFYLISSDNRLRPYSDEGFFKIIHETPALNEGAFVDTKLIKIRGEEKYVKFIQYKTDDGDIIYDVPLLSRDALNILYEIIRRAKNYMPAANSSDPYESYEETKGSFIALESALRVGDKTSMAAAGFTFILHGVGSAVKPLAAAIKDLQDEVKADAEKNGLGEDSLFFSGVDQDDKTKVAITVKMPK